MLTMILSLLRFVIQNSVGGEITGQQFMKCISDSLSKFPSAWHGPKFLARLSG
jgi:hypothetical protein